MRPAREMIPSYCVDFLNNCRAFEDEKTLRMTAMHWPGSPAAAAALVPRLSVALPINCLRACAAVRQSRARPCETMPVGGRTVVIVGRLMQSL